MPSGISAGTIRCRPWRWPIAGPRNSTGKECRGRRSSPACPAMKASVATALERHPARFVGYFMLDPTRDDAEARVISALGLGLRGRLPLPRDAGLLAPPRAGGTIADVLTDVGASRSHRPGAGALRALRRPVRRRAPEARAPEPVRHPLWKPAGRAEHCDAASHAAHRHSPLRCWHAARGADARRPVPQRVLRHVELEWLGPLPAGPHAGAGVRVGAGGGGPASPAVRHRLVVLSRAAGIAPSTTCSARR